MNQSEYDAFLSDADDGDEMDPATRLLVVDGLPNADLPDLPPCPDALKPQWETFCRLYSMGHSAAAAARTAGYSPRYAGQAGWRLLQNAQVIRRIGQLRRAADEQAPRAREEFAARLETIYREAMERGQYSAAVRALTTLNDLMGFGKGAGRA